MLYAMPERLPIGSHMITRTSREIRLGSDCWAFSLCHLDAGQAAPARTTLSEAVEIHTETKKWQSLARIAQVLAQQKDIMGTSLLGTSAHPEMLAKTKEAAKSALFMVTKEEGWKATDGAALANLCLALAILENDTSFAIWALDSLPELDEATVCKLATFIGSKRSVITSMFSADRMDELISPTYPHWRGGRPKAMQIVLDASGSMSGGYLETCKQSISTIIKDFTADQDLIGFLAFAHYSKQIFPLKQKKGQESQMLSDVIKVQTFGGTAFYDAVKEGIELLDKAPGDVSQWLIALTDGADGHSSVDKHPPGRKACQMLKERNINIAVITVGQLPRETIDCVKGYTTACEAGGNSGLHIVAADTQAIADAFQTIASMMDDGLAEHL